MGDTRVKDRAHDLPESGGDEAAARLRDDAYGQMRRVGNDRVEEKAGGDQKLSAGNPYFHIQMAGVALREFEGLKGKSADEKISLTDDKGNIREITVGERRQQLLDIADKEFNSAIQASDRIDQTKIPGKLLEIREQQKNAKSLLEMDQLQRLESMVESMKHAPSVTRFAYATFLADRGDLVKAGQYLEQVARLDPEAGLDPVFKQVKDAVDQGVRGNQDKATMGDNPFVSLQSADEKRQKGDMAGAEADYKTAIAQAEKLDPRLIASQLEEIEKSKRAAAGNPQALEELKALEEGWSSLAHARAITKINYAEFLVSQNRHKEAFPLLVRSAQEDPDLVKDNKEFMELVETARNEGKKPEPFDNPFDHLVKVEEALNKQDLNTARKELEASVRASDKIDRKLMKENKKVIEEALKEEKDPAKRQELDTMLKTYDAFDHASAATRVALARFEIANKNYNQAQNLLTDVERFDPEFARKPETEMDKLKELAQEPSTWQKVWGFTKGVLKELACDAVAVLAGVGAGLGVGALTSLTGPGAVIAGGAAGAAAGSAAYTFMKCVVFGEEFHWSMPLWGALDGASGGMAAMARTALVRVGGKVVSKEMAEAAVIKAGGNVAALEGLEGLKMAHTAQTLSKQGLKEMGKGIGLWGRFKSGIPLINAGSAEYRAALSSYRALKYTNLGVRMGIDAGTLAAGSLVYRGGHEGYKYASGEHKTFGDFAKAYGLGVARDTVTGATLGAYSMGFGSGVMVSGLSNGVREGFNGHKTFGSYAGAVGQGMGADATLAIPNWLLGPSSSKLAQWTPRLYSGADALWSGSSARWRDYFETKDYLQAVEATLQELQSPPKDDAEIMRRMYYMPGRVDPVGR